MNSRVVITLVAVLALAGLLYALLGSGDGEIQTPDADLAKVNTKGVQPAPISLGDKPADKGDRLETHHSKGGWEIADASGATMIVGKDLVPVYDLITGEEIGKAQWSAMSRPARRAELVRPDGLERMKRKTIPIDENLGSFSMPGKSKGDRPKRQWRRSEGG